MLHTHEVVGSNPSRPTTESRVSDNQSLEPFLFAKEFAKKKAITVKKIRFGIY